MRGIITIIFLAFVANAYVTELVTNYNNTGRDSMDKLVDKLANKLTNRVLEVSPLHQEDLDSTTLGKPAVISASNAEGPAYHTVSLKRGGPAVMKTPAKVTHSPFLPFTDKIPFLNLRVQDLPMHLLKTVSTEQKNKQPHHTAWMLDSSELNPSSMLLNPTLNDVKHRDSTVSLKKSSKLSAEEQQIEQLRRIPFPDPDETIRIPFPAHDPRLMESGTEAIRQSASNSDSLLEAHNPQPASNSDSLLEAGVIPSWISRLSIWDKLPKAKAKGDKVHELISEHLPLWPDALSGVLGSASLSTQRLQNDPELLSKAKKQYTSFKGYSNHEMASRLGIRFGNP